MKKYWNIALWILGFAAITSVLAFSGSKMEQLRITGLEVDIHSSDNQYFVRRAEVEEIIKEEYPFLDSLLSREININVLEERLDNHPSIRKAEVYSALDGILRIDVYQKQPLLRIHSSKGDYYIAEEGDSMALSPNYSARVPLITGALSAENRLQLFELFDSLKADEFYQNFFTGLEITNNGNWILYPRPGRHKIELGQPRELKNKLWKLRAFYKNVVDKKNIDSIKTLNLAFESQVICTKY